MNRRNFEKTEPLFLHYCDRTKRGAYAKRFFALLLVALRLPSQLSKRINQQARSENYLATCEEPTLESPLGA